MFLNHNYVLASELVKEMGIQLHSICMLRKEYRESDDTYTIRTMNNCMFLNSKSHKIPNNFKKGMQEHKHELTTLTNKLPASWMNSEFGISEANLYKANIIVDKIVLAGTRRFYVFEENFVQKVTGNIPYILTEKEAHECMAKSEIKGYIKVSRNKYFTWY